MWGWRRRSAAENSCESGTISPIQTMPMGLLVKTGIRLTAVERLSRNLPCVLTAWEWPVICTERAVLPNNNERETESRCGAWTGSAKVAGRQSWQSIPPAGSGRIGNYKQMHVPSRAWLRIREAGGFRRTVYFLFYPHELVAYAYVGVYPR